MWKICSIVAFIFIHKRNKGDKLIHRDGDPYNNHIDNLAYVRVKEVKRIRKTISQ